MKKAFIDFDGTVVEHEYPKIGRTNFGCIEVMYKLQQAEWTLFINSVRCDMNDQSLKDAIKWFENSWMHGKIRRETPLELDFKKIAVNSAKFPAPPWEVAKFKETGIMYIDDQQFNVPLVPAKMSNGFMVNWDEIDYQFMQHKIYE